MDRRNWHPHSQKLTTDAEGRFGAVWVLGTRASEQQQLTVRVDAGKHTGVTTLAATAKPVEVAAVSFRDETTTVKVGVPTLLPIQATDPFGNRFTPPASFTALDTTFLGVDTTGTINARRRGFVRVVVTAATAADTAWVHGIQVVRSIVAQPETLLFHALGQTELLHASLIDDQGHEVVDSLPDVGLAVTTAMGLQAGVPVPTVVDVQAGKPLAPSAVPPGRPGEGRPGHARASHRGHDRQDDPRHDHGREQRDRRRPADGGAR